MADFNSSLPVRTEAAGDVIVKIADATVPAQQLAVGADGSINVTDNGGSLTVDSTDLDIRDLDSAQDSIEVLQATHDNLNANANIQVGDADVANGNPVPVSDAGGSLTVDAVNLDIRDLTHVSDSVKVGDGTDFLAVNADGSINITDNGGSLTVDANNLDIRDLTHVSDSVKIGDGTDFLAVNTDGSINVVPIEDAGTEIVDYNTSAALAGGASSNHDWTSAAASKLYQVFASASGKLKIEVQVETAAASGVFNSIAVGFNSTATPNIDIDLRKYRAVPNGARVRVIRTNKDNQAQDVYSTIIAVQG